MAKIEKFGKVKGYNWRVVDKFHTFHLFKTYREALAFFLQ